MLFRIYAFIGALIAGVGWITVLTLLMPAGEDSGVGRGE